METKNDCLRAENSDRRQSQQSARQELKAKKEELVASCRDVTKLNKKVQALQTEIDEMGDQLQAYQKKNEAKQKQLDKAATTNARSRQRASRALQSKSKEVAEFEGNISTLAAANHQDSKKARDQLFSLVSLLRCNHQSMQKQTRAGSKQEIARVLSSANDADDAHAVERDRLQAEIKTHEESLGALETEIHTLKGPIQMKKNGRDYADERMLLTVQLVSMGVSEEIVGMVQQLCVKHLAQRDLSDIISASTAERMTFRGCELAMHHLGETMVKNAERGYMYATDTTTIQEADRAANTFQLKEVDNSTGDESVRLLRGPIVLWSSHTAEEQFENNFKWIISDTQEVMKIGGVVDPSEVSVEHVTSIMGDRVNESL